MMETIVFKTARALADNSARRMLQVLKGKPDALFVLAAGFTQNETYARFAELVHDENVDISRMKLLGLDEWGGLNGADPGSCRAYINERVIQPLGLKEHQILHFFDGKQDPDGQAEQANAVLDEHGPIDLLALGIGMNGHLGFNEPGADPQARAHHLTLSETSTTIGQKYFGEQKALSTGLTLGLYDLLKAGTILVQVTGAHKKEVIKRLMDKEPGASFTASYLWPTGAVLLTDEAAAGSYRSAMKESI